MTDENLGRTIQLFLVDGKPSGLRKATLHGWTGIVCVSGDAHFSALTKRTEVDRTGIYILVGPHPEKAGEQLAYIGSANTVAERIKKSAEKHDFWETAITITTSDDDLSKGHVEYLEARLIQAANAEKRIHLSNSTTPDTDRRRLPEADRANMEQFLNNIKVILPVIGLDMLKPQPKAVSKPSLVEDTSQQAIFEIRHKSGVKAQAVEEDGEFIVLKDSEALYQAGHASMTSYAGLKAKLLADKVLVKKDNRALQFTQSYAFKSPSAAAAVILDRSSNGRTEWKVKGSNLNYHQWQEQQVEQEKQAE